MMFMFRKCLLSDIIKSIEYIGSFTNYGKNYLYSISYNRYKYYLLFTENDNDQYLMAVSATIPPDIYELFEHGGMGYRPHTVLDNFSYPYFDYNRNMNTIENWVNHTEHVHIDDSQKTSSGSLSVIKSRLSSIIKDGPLYQSGKLFKSIAEIWLSALEDPLTSGIRFCAKLINFIINFKNIPINPCICNLVIAKYKRNAMIYVITDPSGKKIEKATMLTEKCEYDIDEVEPNIYADWKSKPIKNIHQIGYQLFCNEVNKRRSNREGGNNEK